MTESRGPPAERATRWSAVGRFVGWVFGSRLAWHFTIPSVVIVLLVGMAAVFAVTKYMSAAIEADALRESERDAEWQVEMLASALTSEQLTVPARDARYDDLSRIIRSHVNHAGVMRIKIWNPDGQIIYSDEPSLVGRTFPVQGKLAEALGGETAAEVSNLGEDENVHETEHGRMLETYAPIRLEDSPQVVGVLEVYEDYAVLAGRIEHSQRMILVAAIGFVAIYAVLFLVHRWGAEVISRQGGRLLRQKDQLLRQSEEIKQSYHETLEALAGALDQRDHATEDHGRRVSELATTVARVLRLPGEQVEEIAQAAIVHDIGKMILPDAILNKPGPLADEEWTEMRKHPTLGYEMLKRVPVLRAAAEIVHAHHERYDGAGYPRGLKGDQIPVGARIFAVVDTYDAITSDRPYRRAASHEQAMEEIVRCSGSQFDPEVVWAFREMEKKGLFPAWHSAQGGDGARTEAPKAVAGVAQEESYGA